MASTAKPTGCYKGGKSDHWSRDCPSQPASETPVLGALASATAPSSSGFSKAAGTQGVTQGGTQLGSQGEFQRWQGNNQGYKRKEPWSRGSSSSFVAKEKPVKVPVPPRHMPKLTLDLLLGADGLGYVLEKIPRQVTIKGRGHEVEDLRSLLEACLRWHQTLLPYYSYSQSVEKVEKVGSTKRVRLCVRELRQKIEKEEKFCSVDMNAVDKNDGQLLLTKHFVIAFFPFSSVNASTQQSAAILIPLNLMKSPEVLTPCFELVMDFDIVIELVFIQNSLQVSMRQEVKILGFLTSNQNLIHPRIVVQLSTCIDIHMPIIK